MFFLKQHRGKWKLCFHTYARRALYYPDFREEVKYHAGLGVLTRIDDRKFFTGMKVAVTDVEIDVKNPVISERMEVILSEAVEQGRVILNRQMDVEFKKWVANL